MANYTAADIKALRERTGAGMLDVKKALDEANGDAEKALEILRVNGLKGVAKREGRSTSEGLVASYISEDKKTGFLIELNCETDFVAKAPKFVELGEAVLAAVVAADATDAEAGLAADVNGETVQDVIDGLAATLGEKLVLRQVAKVSGDVVSGYLHRTAKDLPPTIGVLIVTDENGAKLAKDITQHVAALAPTFLSREDVPADTVANERRIAEETSRNEGKPEAALPKIIEGRLTGFFKEVTLLEQALVTDGKKSVQQALTDVSGSISQFVRIRVGS